MRKNIVYPSKAIYRNEKTRKVIMKAMTRQQLAAKAGVSAKTLSRWMEAHREELEAQGSQEAQESAE